MKTVLLLSGGLDSSVALDWLRSKNYEVKALSLHYGQRHNKELKAAQMIAQRAKVEHKVVDLSALRSVLGGSSQTDDQIDVPEGHYTAESMKLTVVPNRNMIFLSVAAAWAIAENCESVAYAAHGGDHTIYPDCRPDFVQAIQKTFELCDWKQISLITPFLQLSKAEIVSHGAKLKTPFHLTWSCYKGGDLHCGQCGTCVERKEAFQLAKISDPTIYEQKDAVDDLATRKRI
jgi:7-cyano-7-deazaguanine synthase